jgi:signal transduction histidine kinase/ligand-binding sensor domain-containing protein
LKLKKLSTLIIYFLLVLLTAFTELHAQPRRLQFKYLTPDKGLSSSIASCIIQDHKGLMWIGTADGLNRYDGFNFVVYKNISDDSTSLADNVIRSLYEDHNNDLLVGTEVGLSLYNRAKDQFLNYFYDRSSPLKDIRCTVLKILEDKSGNLWLASTAGLIYFDRVKNQITQYTYDADNPESISSNNAQYIFIDKRANFWVATRSGLNLFKKESGTFKHITRDDQGNSLLNTDFLNIAEDQEGNVWFGSTDGLYSLKSSQEPGDAVLKHYYHDIKDINSLSINLVRSIFVDNSGNVWVGTDNGGLNLFNKEKQNFWHYRKDDYDPRSLNNEAVESIYQDKAGNLWFGTYTGGINIAINNRDGIIKYENLPGAPLSLSHNTVTCFAEDPQGQIWVGTDGGGLNFFDRNEQRFRRYNLKNSELSSNAILCIYEDPTGKLWMGTWEGGLAEFDTKTGKFSSLTTKNSSIQDDNIFAIADGGNNDLWLGSFEHGLIHYEINKQKFTSYTQVNSGIGNEMIIKIEKFTKGRLLIGTTENFQIFNPADNHFVTYSSEHDNLKSLSFPRVTDFMVENDTTIWIGTPDGLNRLNPSTGLIVRYYKKDGLQDNFIKGISSDNSGALWITTNSGVSRFDYRHNRYRNFTKADGLQGNEFSERSILKAKNGDLFMGGTEGFNIIRPEKIGENTTIPEVLITDLKIFNKSVKPGVKSSPLAQNITETKSVTISHNQSVLTFSFAVMDFSAPEKNRYAYKMENFDRDWIYPEDKHEANYTNLNPGRYVFRVKGSNDDGYWNETGTSVQITILPPWWGTWWFRMLLISSIILLFTVFYMTRVAELKKQQILLKKTVESKTKELEELNASKDKFFSIIAHDLKNPFTTIIGFSELLKDDIYQGQQTKTHQFANSINRSAVQTLRLLENLLEWANSQRGKITFNPLSIRISELVDEEFNLVNDMAVEKNIELKSSFPAELTVFADKEMFKTVLRNLLSNAIKFTHRNGKVELQASAVKGGVEISVSDTGIGMSKEILIKLFRIDANLTTRGTEDEKGTGLGLFLCKEFVSKHCGKIWAESEPGRGSIFRVFLPSSNNSGSKKST